MKEKHETAAGAVVFRKNGNVLEFCVIHMSYMDEWRLPKGHVETGESLEQAALREVLEESGTAAEIRCELGANSYQFKKKNTIIHKTNHFFLMSCLDAHAQEPDDEVREVRWLPLAESLALLTWEQERVLVQKAFTVLQE